MGCIVFFSATYFIESTLINTVVLPRNKDAQVNKESLRQGAGWLILRVQVEYG